MEPSEVYGNSLFMQIIWMRLPDRSLGWETSNRKKKDYGYLILKGHFLSELSRHNALEIFFQVFSFKKACTSSACASASPKSSSFAVSGAGLRLQLQPWLQPRSSLRAASGARHTETHSSSKLLTAAMIAGDLVH